MILSDSQRLLFSLGLGQESWGLLKLSHGIRFGLVGRDKCKDR